MHDMDAMPGLVRISLIQMGEFMQAMIYSTVVLVAGGLHSGSIGLLAVKGLNSGLERCIDSQGDTTIFRCD